MQNERGAFAYEWVTARGWVDVFSPLIEKLSRVIAEEWAKPVGLFGGAPSTSAHEATLAALRAWQRASFLAVLSGARCSPEVIGATLDPRMGITALGNLARARFDACMELAVDAMTDTRMRESFEREEVVKTSIPNVVLEEEEDSDE